MKEIRKETRYGLKEGETVVVCKGVSKIPCVVRRCGITPCSSCIIRGVCTQWDCLVVHQPSYCSAAAFVPVEDIVE